MFLQIVFEFVSGIEESLANKLKAVGIIVIGNILPDPTNHETGVNGDESSEEEIIDNRCVINVPVI